MRVREREKYWSFEVIGMLLLFWGGRCGMGRFFCLYPIMVLGRVWKMVVYMIGGILLAV
jgi:hypothetical protein